MNKLASLLIALVVLIGIATPSIQAQSGSELPRAQISGGFSCLVEGSQGVEQEVCHRLTNVVVLEQVNNVWQGQVTKNEVTVLGSVVIATFYDHNQDGFTQIGLEEVEFYLLEVVDGKTTNRVVSLRYQELNEFPDLVYIYLAFTNIQRWNILVFYNLNLRNIEEVASPGIEEYMVLYHPNNPNDFLDQALGYYFAHFTTPFFG